MTHAVRLSVRSAPESQALASKGSLKNLGWLIRYARHTGLDLPQVGDPLPTIRAMFSAGAWRLLCRSNKRDFLPILRNRELNLNSLVDYCDRLVKRSFVSAPPAVLLHFFVIQRRLYFNLPCRIPEDDNYELMRVASRSAALKTSDIASVANWADQTDAVIGPKHRWSALVVRAKKFWEQQKLTMPKAHQEPWHFFCRDLDWRGYRIEPITLSSHLWLEARRQGNCLYKLRFECAALKPSRFFSIRRAGRRVATLELSWRAPEQGDRGMNQVLGTWELQDLRKSFNRLPDETLLSGMQDFAKQYNTWAKRPGRMPQGHLAEVRERVCRIKGRDHLPIWRASFAALS